MGEQIEVIRCKINIDYYINNMPTITGWTGSAIINGGQYDGEFGVIETYTNDDGVEFIINWSDYIPEIKDLIEQGYKI